MNHVITDNELCFHQLQRQQRVLLARTGLNRRGHGDGAQWLRPASLKPRSLDGAVATAALLRTTSAWAATASIFKDQSRPSDNRTRELINAVPSNDRVE